MSSKTRRKYDQDFKRNAVLLCAEPGRSVAEVADNLSFFSVKEELTIGGLYDSRMHH